METCISCFVKDNQRTWFNYLSNVQLVLNNLNLFADFTPNFLMFLRKLIFDAFLHFNNSFDNLTLLEIGENNIFLFSIFVFALNSLCELFVKVQAYLLKAFIF